MGFSWEADVVAEVEVWFALGTVLLGLVDVAVLNSVRHWNRVAHIVRQIIIRLALAADIFFGVLRTSWKALRVL